MLVFYFSFSYPIDSKKCSTFFQNQEFLYEFPVRTNVKFFLKFSPIQYYTFLQSFPELSKPKLTKNTNFNLYILMLFQSRWQPGFTQTFLSLLRNFFLLFLFFFILHLLHHLNIILSTEPWH